PHQQAGGRHGGDGRRQGLLARRLRRWHLQLRRRGLRRIGGEPDAEPAGGRDRGAPRRGLTLPHTKAAAASGKRSLARRVIATGIIFAAVPTIPAIWLGSSVAATTTLG